MSFYVLDTDHITLHQRNHPPLVERLRSVHKNRMAVTGISAEEQIKGRFAYLNRRDTDLTRAYSLLLTTIEYFCDFRILPFNQSANNLYNNFRQQKIRVGALDMRIAAVVLEQESILLTRNRRDFERIPGLQFEDWSL